MSEPNGTNGNGTQGKILWWIIGGIITPFLLSGFNTLFGDSKRIAALESTFQVINGRLEHLENRIEKLLERRP